MVMDLQEELRRARGQVERMRREVAALRRDHARNRGGALVLRREVQDLLGGR
jgi:hypothetical protein